MNEERMRQDLLILAIALSIIVAGLQLAVIPFMTTTEVLTKDFDLDLRMGPVYGSISGEIRAGAMDIESSGKGNSVVLRLSPEADEFHNLEASKEHGELSVFVQDQGAYSTQRLQANASTLELLTSPECSMDELRFSDVNASLITSHHSADYGITFNWTEGTSIPGLLLGSREIK